MEHDYSDRQVSATVILSMTNYEPLQPWRSSLMQSVRNRSHFTKLRVVAKTSARRMSGNSLTH